MSTAVRSGPVVSSTLANDFLSSNSAQCTGPFFMARYDRCDPVPHRADRICSEQGSSQHIDDDGFDRICLCTMAEPGKLC